MLLLRKVLSSIRIHLIYSAKTGSSQRSFTQFLDIADWQGDRRWQSQHQNCRSGPLRNSSGLSDASKLYKSITDNSYFPFSCDEAPCPGRSVYSHECVWERRASWSVSQPESPLQSYPDFDTFFLHHPSVCATWKAAISQFHRQDEVLSAHPPPLLGGVAMLSFCREQVQFSRFDLVDLNIGRVFY